MLYGVRSAACKRIKKHLVHPFLIIGMNKAQEAAQCLVQATVIYLEDAVGFFSPDSTVVIDVDFPAPDLRNSLRLLEPQFAFMQPALRLYP